jgi:hypothetical protein
MGWSLEQGTTTDSCRHPHRVLLGPVIVTVPKQHNDRLHDVLMAALHDDTGREKDTGQPCVLSRCWRLG